MRIAISHNTVYRYGRPAKGVIQVLRLTPRNHAAMHVAKWRVEIDADARLRQSEDAFGNVVQTLNAAGAIESFSIHVEGEVETTDSAGILSGAVERFPPELYLRATDLTVATEDMVVYAETVRAASGRNDDTLALLHALMAALNADIRFDVNPTDATTTAAQAFSNRHGVCQDHTHIFCAMARHLGVPARYISGYFRRADGVIDQDAGHAWAEAFVPELGWVGFDTANGICSTDAHVRVAVALDYLGAAPVRGSRLGGVNEKLDVAIKVMQLQMQG